MQTAIIPTLATARIAIGNGSKYGRLNCTRCPKACTARRMFAVLVGGEATATIVCKRCKNRLAAKLAHTHTKGA